MTPESIALTEAETAQRLGVSAATLRNWRRQEVGPVYRRFGRTVRYLESDLEKYIAANVGVRPSRAGNVRG